VGEEREIEELKVWLAPLVNHSRTVAVQIQ